MKIKQSEIEKRRDDIVRAMIAMPPAPNKPAVKKKTSRPKRKTAKADKSKP